MSAIPPFLDGLVVPIDDPRYQARSLTMGSGPVAAPRVVSNQQTPRVMVRQTTPLKRGVGAGLGVAAISYLSNPEVAKGKVSVLGMDIPALALVAGLAGVAEIVSDKVESYIPSQIGNVGAAGVTVGDFTATGVAPVMASQVLNKGFNRDGWSTTGMDSAKVYLGSLAGRKVADMMF